MGARGENTAMPTQIFIVPGESIEEMEQEVNHDVMGVWIFLDASSAILLIIHPRMLASRGGPQGKMERITPECRWVAIVHQGLRGWSPF